MTNKVVRQSKPRHLLDIANVSSFLVISHGTKDCFRLSHHISIYNGVIIQRNGPVKVSIRAQNTDILKKTKKMQGRVVHITHVATLCHLLAYGEKRSLLKETFNNICWKETDNSALFPITRTDKFSCTIRTKLSLAKLS